MKRPSLGVLGKFRRRCEIALLKTALQLLKPLEAFLEVLSGSLRDKETKNYLQLGKAVYRCYLQEKTSLQMQKLMASYQLHLMRDELVARLRENRQLQMRLQMHEYEEDAAETNRDSLLELIRSKSGLNERNGQLKSELSRTQFLLEAVEHDIDEHIPSEPRKRRREDTVNSGSLNNECSCSFRRESASCSEAGTVKVYSSSTESFDLDSTWVSKHEIIVHVSSSIPRKPD